MSEEQIINEAQARLERLRQQRAASTPVAPQSLPELLPEIFPTAQTSGDWCGEHRLTLPCEECQRQEEEAAARRKKQATAALQGINIGARYRGATFADFQTYGKESERRLKLCQRYAETFPERLAKCDNLLMLGNPGTGKNMLAACICQEVAAQGHSAIHTTAMKLVRKIKESWGRDKDKTEQEAINDFAKPDLLVVDEVGVQYGSETERILLFEVINERYEAMRPTIVISNLNVQDVEAFLGPRIMDRFHEGKSAVLEFTWESYRRRK